MHKWVDTFKYKENNIHQGTCMQKLVMSLLDSITEMEPLLITGQDNVANSLLISDQKLVTCNHWGQVIEFSQSSMHQTAVTSY